MPWYAVGSRYGGTEFRVNDKVMQIKNNYEKSVYNGAMGTIAEVDTKDKVSSQLATTHPLSCPPTNC